MMISINVQETWVILIGTGTFHDPNLPAIPAVENNLAAMRRVLIDKNIVGISPAQILEIKNEGNLYPQLIAKLEQLPKLVETLLVYYSGHGFPHKNDVYLAATNSEKDHPEKGSIAFNQLWEETCNRATHNVLYILDCCRSGMASLKPLGSKNVVLLTASLPTDNAKVLPGQSLTPFTNCLIQLLEQGYGNEPAFLTPRILYEELEKRLVNQGHPKPSYKHQMGEIHFFKNCAYYELPECNFNVDELQPDQLYKKLIDLIDSKVLTDAFKSEKTKFLSSIEQAVKYEIEKLNTMDTLALTINNEKIDPSPSLRYAKALHCYMKRNKFEGEFVDSYASPYIIHKVKFKFKEFFSSDLVINRLSERLKKEFVRINQNIISQMPVSDRQKVTFALSSILEEDITKFVRDVVVSNSFQESMSQVLNELRTEVITTATVTATVSSLIVVGLSAKVGVITTFLIPVIALIIAYKAVTFKNSFSNKVSKNIYKAVDQELYDNVSFKITEVFKEAVVSRIVENFANYSHSPAR